MFWLVFFAVLALCAWLYFKFFKIPKLKNVVFVDGTLGSGKTVTCIAWAIRLYKRNVRRWRIACVFRKMMFKSLPEKPLLYSNIPLADVPFVPLTLDVLTRDVRVAFKSVILIDESSLLVDQYDFKDRYVSDRLREFFKLYRHESHGGTIIINSQSTADLHYSIKAVLSEYFYIHHRFSLGLFSVLKVQEMAYSSDRDAHNMTNVNNADVEDNLRLVFLSNRYYKKYDSYCYSAMTDRLPVSDKWIVLKRSDSLKVSKPLTFKKPVKKGGLKDVEKFEA